MFTDVVMTVRKGTERLEDKRGYCSLPFWESRCLPRGRGEWC